MNYFMILSENRKIHELIRVVSRFPRYISRHFEQCNMNGVGGGGLLQQILQKLTRSC